MKKLLMILPLLAMCLCLSAKTPKHPVMDIDREANSRIVLINDSTIEYFNVYGIQVAQPADVYSAIIKIPDNKKDRPTLVIMRPGSYIWVDETMNEYGHYILYCGKAFDRVVLRATEVVDTNVFGQ